MFEKEEILKKIQENKFLKNLDKNTIIFFIEKHFKKITNKKEFEKITKDIKKNLNDIYKQFLTNKYNKKEKLLEKKEFLKILKIHKSTKERFENYKKIYKKIFENYKPKKIADLGCGLNPISYLILKKILKKNIKFFSTDISKKDCDFLNKFFKKSKNTRFSKKL